MSTDYLIFFGHPAAGSASVAAHLAAACAEAGRDVLLIDGGAGQTAALVSQGQSVDDTGWISGYKGLASRDWGRQSATILGAAIATRTPAPELVFIDLADNLDRLQQLLLAGLVGQVLAVTDAEPASLRAVNRLWQALENRDVAASLIGNNLSEPYAGSIVQDFARKTGIGLEGYLPRARAVIRSAFFGETVIEAAPLSHAAYLYRDLAKLLSQPGTPSRPMALDDEEFRDWAADWGDRLYDLGEGYVGYGEGI
jgi:nitrogenase iron protein NifH